MRNVATSTVEPIDARTLAVWADFLRVHATLTEVLERELADAAGLPLAWYDVLTQLDAAPEGRLRMQELAAAVVLSKSGLTRLVDRLELAGLVARTSSSRCSLTRWARPWPSSWAPTTHATPPAPAGPARPLTADTT